MMKASLALTACWIFVLLIIPPLHAEELSGQIERVDWETVTLRGANNNKVIVRVDGQKRLEAAQFLGKTVRVEIRGQDGNFSVMKFEHESSLRDQH
jgi:hypothetical protein